MSNDGDASRVSRKQNTGREAFSRQLLEMIPIAPFLAFGLILAWSQLSLESVISLSGSQAPGLPSVRSLSTCCNGIVLTMAALFIGPAKKALSKARFIWICGIVTSLSGAMTLLCVDIGLSPDKSYPVLAIAYLLRGAGSAALFLKAAELYGRLPGRTCIMYLGWCHVLAAFTFFVVIGMGGYALFNSNNDILVWLGLCILPLCVAGLTTMKPQTDEQWLKRDAVYSDSIHTLPSSFWRFVAIVFVFSFIVSMSSSLWSGITGNASDGRIINLVRIGAALLLIWSALAFDANRFHLGKIYVTIVALSIVIISMGSLVHDLIPGWGTLSGIAMLLFRMLHWVILSLIVCQRNISSILVFGIGAGAQAIGTGFGDLIPMLFLPSGIDQQLALTASLICAIIILFCAFVLFSEKELDELFSPANEDAIEFADLFGPVLINDMNQKPLNRQDVKNSRPLNDQEHDLPSTDEHPMQTPDSTAPSKRPEEARVKCSFNEAIMKCAGQYGLSIREIDVFRFLAMGYNAQAIAEKLVISWNTVRGHSRNIYTKLDVHSRTELMELVDSVRKDGMPDKKR